MAGVPKSVVRNVPRYRLGNVPNFQGRNSIQSIILHQGPYQAITIDPLGHIALKPWVGARQTILCYPLLIKCLESSAITVKLMFRNDTMHVIMKLLELESDYAVKIKHISMDFGSNLIIKNVNPKNPHSKHLFDMLESSCCRHRCKTMLRQV